MTKDTIRTGGHRQRNAATASLFPLRFTRRLAKRPVPAGGLTETIATGRLRGVLRVLIKPRTQRRILLLEAINPFLEPIDCRTGLSPFGFVFLHQVRDRAKQLAVRGDSDHDIIVAVTRAKIFLNRRQHSNPPPGKKLTSYSPKNAIFLLD